VAVWEEKEQMVKMALEYKAKAKGLEKEVITLKEDNYKLLTSKGTSL